MRTRAWAMKTLNTQLGSWTQLRHNTVLYAKPLVPADSACVYPTGFVEPRIKFWDALGRMAANAAEQIKRLHYEGQYTIDSPEVAAVNGFSTNVIQLAEIQQRQIEHLSNFAETVSRLAALAEKELAQECFTPEDLNFIDALMEAARPVCVYSDEYTGWYPRLFYRSVSLYWDRFEFHLKHGASASTALTVDVQTDLPDADLSDPGSVLHEAVGEVNLLLIAVDNGPDRFICAGPVLSHYEFETIGQPRRMADDEWEGARFSPPNDSSVEGFAPPPWTQPYLVPGPRQGF